MSKEYSEIARQIVELLEHVPVKRYGEINLVLAQELGLMLADIKEVSEKIYGYTLPEIKTIIDFAKSRGLK